VPRLKPDTYCIFICSILYLLSGGINETSSQSLVIKTFHQKMPGRARGDQLAGQEGLESFGWIEKWCRIVEQARLQSPTYRFQSYLYHPVAGESQALHLASWACFPHR
jgi:hypothetical protein